MSITTVLALANGTTNAEAAMTSAVAVARRFGAHLEVLHVRANPAEFVPIMGVSISAPMLGQLMDSIEAEAVEHRNKARAAYDRICIGSGLSVGWHESTGHEPDAVSRAGRFADLLVMVKHNGALTETLETALFGSGRPVLVLGTQAVTSIGERIVVAWNGSAEAARAVTSALPFLRLANEIHVVIVEEEEREKPGPLIPYLARHGVKATIHMRQLENRSTGAILLEAAHGFGADLLVMGAYGRSRVREWILGGATRDVLAKATLPVLMMH